LIWTSKKEIDVNKAKVNNKISCSTMTLDNNNDNKYQICHRRFCHYYTGNFINMINKINKYMCKVYALVKLKNFTFHHIKPFQLIHMDTITIKDRFLNGNKYTVFILDDFSKYGRVLFVDYDNFNFRVLSCLIFYLIPKQLRRKFDSTSLLCIFIENDRNPLAYKIYDPTNNKIIISRPDLPVI